MRLKFGSGSDFARLSVVSAAFAFGLCLLSQAANSASIERLSDGRIIVKAFGERMAFDESDAPNVNILINVKGAEDRCVPAGEIFVYLSDWLS